MHTRIVSSVVVSLGGSFRWFIWSEVDSVEEMVGPVVVEGPGIDGEDLDGVSVVESELFPSAFVVVFVSDSSKVFDNQVLVGKVEIWT